MKILLYDIEITPNLAYIWGKYEQTAIAFEQEWEILCWSAKWLDKNKIVCYTKEGEKDDKRIVKELWKMFDEADIVIGHNSKKFDNKKVTARFLYHGLTPPSPYKSIDTLQEIKKVASFNSHKLDDLGELLGEGRKIKTDFSLWLGCMKDDHKAWVKMARYNKQDVKLLEKIFLRVRPYINNYPSLSEEVSCPRCNSVDYQRRGYRLTLTGKFARMQCNQCGGWFSSRIKEEKRNTKVISN